MGGVQGGSLRSTHTGSNLFGEYGLRSLAFAPRNLELLKLNKRLRQAGALTSILPPAGRVNPRGRVPVQPPDRHVAGIGRSRGNP